MVLLTFTGIVAHFFDTIIVTYFHPSVYPLFPSVISSFFVRAARFAVDGETKDLIK